MKNIKMGFVSVLLVLGLAVGVHAQTLDLTFADMDAIPYCDGMQLTIDGGDLSVIGSLTGCASGPVQGCISYSLIVAGVGAGVYEIPNSGFTQLTFNPPVWIYYDSAGDIVSYGLILYQPAPLALKGSGISHTDVAK